MASAASASAIAFVAIPLFFRWHGSCDARGVERTRVGIEGLRGNNLGSVQLHLAIAVALCVMVLSSIQALGYSLSGAIGDAAVADAHAAASVSGTPPSAATPAAIGASFSAAQDVASEGHQTDLDTLATTGDEAVEGVEEVGGLGAFWGALVRKNPDPNAEPWRRVWWRGALATGVLAGSSWTSFKGIVKIASKLVFGPLRTSSMLLRSAIAMGVVDIGRLLLIEVVPNLAVFLYDQLGLDSRFGLFGGEEMAGQEVARTARRWTSRLFAAGTALTLTVIQEVGGLFWGHDPLGLKEVFLSNYHDWYPRIDQSKEKVWNFFGVRVPSEAGDAPQTDWWQGLKEAGRLTVLGSTASSAQDASASLRWSSLSTHNRLGQLRTHLPWVGEVPSTSLMVGPTQ